MNFKLILTLCLFSSGLAFGSQHQMIDTLGTSSKGQYVAVEEYGFSQEKQSYYVTIKVMNVWKKEYVGSPVVVEQTVLQEARRKAKDLAQSVLNKYKINT